MKISEDRQIHILEILFLVFITIFLFGRTLGYGLVWDDNMLISNNPYFQQNFHLLDVFKKGLWEFSSVEDHYPYYRPLVTLVYWLETKLWGFDPTYFHAANVLMHLCSLLLVWLVALKFKLSSFGRRIASVFFALHPAQVSCVAFVSCHGDLMVQIFGLLAVLFWMREGKARWISLLFVFMAMLSKEAGVILPLVLIAYDLIIRKKSFRNVAIWTPVLLWFFYFALRFWAIHEVSYESFHWDLLWNNQGAFRTFAYISRVFFPIPTSQDPILPTYSPLISALLFVGFIFLVIVIFQRSKNNSRVHFFWCWFFLTTLIIANWAGQIVRFSDQLLYIPMVPISLLIGSIHFSSRRIIGYWVILFSVFAVVSYSQIPFWKNEYEFWKNESHYRKDDPAVMMNFVSEYNARYKPENACELYLEVEKLLQSKYNAKIHFLLTYNLGNCYREKNLFLAEDYYRKAIGISNRHWLAKNNLIDVLVLQNKLPEALQIATELVMDRPNLFGPWRTLGVVQAKMKNFAGAVASFQHAQKINPEDLEIQQMINDAKALEAKMDALKK